jgi:hypothetical protein
MMMAQGEASAIIVTVQVGSDHDDVDSDAILVEW